MLQERKKFTEQGVQSTGSSKHREFKDREFKDREFKEQAGTLFDTRLEPIKAMGSRIHKSHGLKNPVELEKEAQNHHWEAQNHHWGQRLNIHEMHEKCPPHTIFILMLV